MKVVPRERGIHYGESDGPWKLFEFLRDNGVMGDDTDSMILAASHPGN